MKRLLPLLLLCACSLRAPRVESPPCSSSGQCDNSAVCFLGECRPHSSALSLVVAEVRPANDSQLGVLQVPGIDLQQSVLHDFQVVPPLAASGTVGQDQDADAGVAAVAGALVTFTDHDPAIPDRVEQVVARSDATGSFSARLPQGLWDVLVQPPAPLPPFRPASALSTVSPQLALVLPRVGLLAQFQSSLTANGVPLTGADVTAVDPAGRALSTPAAVQADGSFSLYLPPGTTTSGYTLQVGPPPDLDAGMLAPALDPLPNYDKLPPTDPVTVTLPPVATLQGVVVDAAGMPVPYARVYARSNDMPWTLSRSTTADAAGAWALVLRAGDYVAEAAPASIDGPAVSGEVPVSVSASGSSLKLTCPPKLRGFGAIVRSTGAPVGSNFQVTATRLADRLLTTRAAVTLATDSAGIWQVTADPGRYRVEVVPPADTGLPRKVVQMDLGVPSGSTPVQLPQIQLSPPLVVGGTVHGAPPGGSDQPVVGATVSFYALDAQGHGILLGSAPTDTQGHYKVVLPDVAQPGAAE